MTSTPAPETEPAPATPLQKALAEGLGSFVVLGVAMGAAVFSQIGFAGAGLVYGVAIAACGYAFGRLSGGHFNPVVSVGAAMSGRLAWKDAGLYAAAQIIGGIVAGIAVLLVSLTADVGYEFGDPLAPPVFGDQGGIALFGTLLAELVVAFVMVLVVLGLFDSRGLHAAFAPLAYGLFAFGIVSVLGFSDSAANPARALSTAFFSGGDALVQQWLFVLVPLVGGAAAGLVHPLVFGQDGEPVAGSGLSFSSGKPAQGQAWYGQPGQPGQAGQPGQPQWGGQPAYGGEQGYQNYQQPGHGEQAGQPGQGGQPGQQAPAEQPIIQDGWQWDPQAQQWIPAQQQPPQGGGWSASGGESTQIRPTEGR